MKLTTQISDKKHIVELLQNILMNENAVNSGSESLHFIFVKEQSFMN